jgi:N-acetylglucosamine kinase-like BadF-type ATPase
MVILVIRTQGLQITHYVLFGCSMLVAGKDKQFVLGIDGGGTHTSACLISTRGEFIAQLDDRPVSYARRGGLIADPIAQLGSRLLRKAGIKKKQLVAAAVCFTGVGRESDRQIVLQALRRKKLAPKIVVDSDAIAALAGALGARPGIVVIAGTGSIAFARDRHGGVHRVGGWGFLLGDEGSGFAIAREGLNAALQDFDGRGPKTQLRPIFEEKFRLARIDEIISQIYSRTPDRGKLASLAPLIFDAARNGDAVATEIIQRAGREYGRLIIAALAHLRDEVYPVPVALMGNLFQQKEMLLPGMMSALAEENNKIKLVEPRFPPAFGAALMGLSAMQIIVDEKLLRRVEESYGRHSRFIE